MKNMFGLVTGLMIILVCWLPIALCVFHTYLLCANVTTVLDTQYLIPKCSILDT